MHKFLKIGGSKKCEFCFSYKSFKKGHKSPMQRKEKRGKKIKKKKAGARGGEKKRTKGQNEKK